MKWQMFAQIQSREYYRCGDSDHEGRYLLVCFLPSKTWEMTDTLYDITCEVYGIETAFEDFLKDVQDRINDLQIVKNAAENMMEKENTDVVQTLS